MTKTSLSILFILFVWLVPVLFATADTEQPAVLLGPFVPRGFHVGPDVDFSGINLNGSEFVGQNLTGAVFDGCDLKGVRIHDCWLNNASFKNASLRGAVLSECKIENADFTNAVINGMLPLATGTRLSKQQLMSTRSYREKDLSQCSIVGDRFSNAEEYELDLNGMNLSNAVLAQGDFRPCNLAGAKIDGVTFRSSTISFDQIKATRNFAKRDFANVVFDHVILTGAVNFSNQTLDGASLSFQSESPPKLDGASINRIQIYHQSIGFSDLQATKNYRHGDLTGMWFNNFRFANADLRGINLTGSKFSRCDFESADMTDAVITDCDFRYSSNLTMEQIKSTWNFRHRRLEKIEFPETLQLLLDKLPAPE